MKIKIYLALLWAVWSFPSLSQETIYLQNPSFEDIPRNSSPPASWFDCGFAGESPPDVQPHGGFNVIKPAYDGNTYLGMVVRDNDTWESVSQQLSSPMLGGICYTFSIFLARSEIYSSVSRLNNQPADYTTPVKLRIYGGNGFCDKRALLGETSLVISARWLKYNFTFRPTEDLTFITFEAFYNTPTLFPYNGNILLDNASAIEPVPCDTINSSIYIPTAFSPNDDGINDLFQVHGELRFVANIKSLKVFDRWGNLVFGNENLTVSDGWDGYFKGKKMPNDVYAYIAEIEFIDGTSKLFKGDVTLLR